MKACPKAGSSLLLNLHNYFKLCSSAIWLFLCTMWLPILRCTFNSYNHSLLPTPPPRHLPGLFRTLMISKPLYLGLYGFSVWRIPWWVLLIRSFVPVPTMCVLLHTFPCLDFSQYRLRLRGQPSLVLAFSVTHDNEDPVCDHLPSWGCLKVQLCS